MGSANDGLMNQQSLFGDYIKQVQREGERERERERERRVEREGERGKERQREREGENLGCHDNHEGFVLSYVRD